MVITPETPIATLVRQIPASIAVLQKHGVAFCCTGATPLAAACAHHGLEADRLLEEIEEARMRHTEALPIDAPIALVIRHIQEHYHQPLREELPRISAMLTKLVARHGERLPEVLPPLQVTFEQLRAELMVHMAKEDQGLFPALISLDASAPGSEAARQWIHNPIEMLEAEHNDAVEAMQRMRMLTDSYTPPDDACPTFRGILLQLSELEQELHAHIRLEQDTLFPRALAYAVNLEARS
jgi:regulator of cell morphogenesis and NO signaling